MRNNWRTRNCSLGLNPPQPTAVLLVMHHKRGSRGKWGVFIYSLKIQVIHPVFLPLRCSPGVQCLPTTHHPYTNQETSMETPKPPHKECREVRKCCSVLHWQPLKAKHLNRTPNQIPNHIQTSLPQSCRLLGWLLEAQILFYKGTDFLIFCFTLSKYCWLESQLMGCKTVSPITGTYKWLLLSWS